MTARRGFALVSAILLALCMTVLASGMLAIAAREAAVARAHLRLLQARAAAEGGARAAVHRWSTDRYEAMEDGEARVESPGDAARITITRLTADRFLVVAEASPPGLPLEPPGGPAPPTAKAALIVDVLRPDGMTTAFPAAVIGDSVVRLDAGSVAAGSACTPRGAELPGVLAPDVISGAATVDGSPPVLRDPPPRLPPPLAGPTVASLADLSAGGSVTPAPVSADGRCVAGPTNWGDPAPLRACHQLRPVIHAAGDLLVRGGRGRGVLLVDGDLRLESGFTFHGVVLVRGHLSIGDDVLLRGAVRARSVQLDGGAVTLDACDVRDVLAAPALRRPLRPPDRWWLPVF